MITQHKSVEWSRYLFWGMGIVTFLSVFLYGIGNLVSMPAVSPDGFIPQSLDAAPSPHSWLAKLSPLFVLLYALSFLPVVVLFTIEKYRIDPPAMIVGGCLLVVSLLVELINALPLTALMLAPVRRPSMSPEVLLFLGQVDATRFMAYDVAGFTLAYMGLFVYAIAFFRSNRWLSGLVLTSIVLFVANVPFLWIAPPMAVILMAASILVFSILPLLLVRAGLSEIKPGS